MTGSIRINFSFLEQEDRLCIEILREDLATRFLLTRRVTRRALKGIADLLVRTSPVMARAPLAQRNEVIHFEHLCATQPDHAGEAATAAAAPDPAPSRATLVHTLSIETHPQHFAVSLIGDGDIAEAMAFGRAELHRLLASLHQLAQIAEWGLDRDAAWLADLPSAAADIPLTKC